MSRLEHIEEAEPREQQRRCPQSWSLTTVAEATSPDNPVTAVEVVHMTPASQSQQHPPAGNWAEVAGPVSLGPLATVM